MSGRAFDRHESGVRLYCRSFPAVFTRAEGAYLYDERGRRWLDFWVSAGSLNYGHSHPLLKRALLRHIEGDGIVNSLDLYTTPKEAFLNTLNEIVLAPRALSFRCQFCGPTGTNAVEAALTLAKKVTGRRGVVAFSNSFHGMTAGSMAISSSTRRRAEHLLSASWVTFMPFDGFTGLDNEIAFVRKMLKTPGGGISPPAAFIVELVQAEGGVNVASTSWVRAISELARELDALLIVDEIQTGCGRTGTFFSFEHHGIVPDIVCVSKSISGYGLPMSLVLLAPSLDVWEPGEHTGTFRGFTYAYVTATEALRQFWAKPEFLTSLRVLEERLSRRLRELRAAFPAAVLDTPHVGMIAGVRTPGTHIAQTVQRACFERGLILETCGWDGATLKLLPSLTVTPPELDGGMALLSEALEAVSHVL